MKRNIKLTTHAKERFNQRSDYNNAERKNNANAAYNKGYDCCQFIDPLYTFLKQKSASRVNGEEIAKVYKDYVYIFCNIGGHKLITVYKIPDEFLPIDKYLAKVESEEDQSKLIFLEDKITGDIKYWSESGITDDIAEAIEFKSEVKAKRYLENTKSLRKLSNQYKIIIF